MLERYELVRLLGRGAAGDVYLARDRLLGGREVALKRISARVDESLRRAFEREFATMASLSLPGVAQVYDFGVMRGRPARSTRAPTSKAARSIRPPSARQRRRARAAAVRGRARDRAAASRGRRARRHQARQRHHRRARRRARDRLRPRARDWARDRASAAAGGTLPFMAPELLRGEAPSVQSDVFALGVTLWLLLTARVSVRPRRLHRAARSERPRSRCSSDALTRARARGRAARVARTTRSIACRRSTS